MLTAAVLTMLVTRMTALQTFQKGRACADSDEVYGVAFNESRWRLQAAAARHLDDPPPPTLCVLDGKTTSVQKGGDTSGCERIAETYSQSFEDFDFYANFVAHPKKKWEKPGNYVEIGALTGLWFSNTKLLEDTLGWNGLLIEAAPSSVKQLRKNRPSKNNLIVGEAVCPDGQGSMEFELGNQPCTNGDPSTMTDEFQKKWHPAKAEAEIISVPCRPLGSMLRQYLKHSGGDSIDFFSLDVEGGELKVLETMDWSVPVKVWCIEFDGSDAAKELSIRKLMSENGYSVANVTRSSTRNEWFVPSDEENVPKPWLVKAKPWLVK